MKSENQLVVENTRRKLAAVESFYAKKQALTTGNAHVHKLTLQSLKKTINQLKEDLVRYEARSASTKMT